MGFNSGFKGLKHVGGKFDTTKVIMYACNIYVVTCTSGCECS